MNTDNNDIIFPPTALLRAIGVAQQHLVACPNSLQCNQKPADNWKVNDKFPYVLDLACNKCQSHWYICTLCDRINYHYTDIIKLNRHCIRKNKNHPLLSKKPRLIDYDSNNVNVNNEETQIMDQNNGSIVPDTTNNVNDNLNPYTFTDSPSDFSNSSENIINNSTNTQQFTNNAEINLNNENTAKTTDSNNKHIRNQLMSANNNFNKLHNLPNEIANKYFTYQQYGLGPQYLNSVSQYHNEIHANQMDAYESQTIIYLSYLIRTLSFGQRCHLTEIINRVIIITENKQNPDYLKNNISPTDIPICYTNLRKYILEGKYSIYNNLPHPPVYADNNHAHLLLSDIIKDALAHGLDCPIIGLDSLGSDFELLKNNYLTNCVKARRLHNNLNKQSVSDNCYTHIFVLIWSDSFEPNYSIKSKRQSVHIITCTIVQPISSKKIYYTHTR